MECIPLIWDPIGITSKRGFVPRRGHHPLDEWIPLGPRQHSTSPIIRVPWSRVGPREAPVHDYFLPFLG